MGFLPAAFMAVTLADSWYIAYTLLNVGDQDSDLEGGYARNRVKLPNPFYFIP